MWSRPIRTTDNPGLLRCSRLPVLWLLGLLATRALIGSQPHPPIPHQIHGVKLYLAQDDLYKSYPDYDQLVNELKQTGVNAIFTTLYEGETAYYPSRILPNREKAIDLQKLRHCAGQQKLLFGAICQIFYDADTLTKRPELTPIDQNGDGRFLNWQKLVCPSDLAYRRYKLSIVKEIARELHPDVISLDFMRFPTTWEVIPRDANADEIRNYCFCDRCLERFQKESRIMIPSELNTVPLKSKWIFQHRKSDWVRWKTKTITSFVTAASKAVKQIDPKIKVSVHVVPWGESTFQNGLITIAGQDVAALGKHVDYLSPMIYHKLIGHPVEDIHALTAELHAKSRKPILPSIQAAQVETEGEELPSEFRNALESALAKPSAGTLIYHWGELRLGSNPSALRTERNHTFQEVVTGH